MKKKVDSLGRIGIPKSIRDDLTSDRELYLSLEYNSHKKEIILKKTENACAFCGSCHDLLKLHQNFLCKNCLIEFNKRS